MIHRFLRLGYGLAGLALVAGCGAAQPKQSGEGDNFDQTLPGKAQSSGEDSKWEGPGSAKAAKPDDLNDDQKAQIEIALRRGGDKSANCGSVVPDAPRGEGEVKVTFDGKKGRAVDVQVGAPWAGTPAESCIKRAFIGEIIVPFEGQLEVPYTVKIAAKGDSGKGGKK